MDSCPDHLVIATRSKVYELLSRDYNPEQALAMGLKWNRAQGGSLTEDDMQEIVEGQQNVIEAERSFKEEQASPEESQLPPQRPSQRLFHDVEELPDEDTLMLVDNYIPAHGVTSIFGDSNTFKSFLALDIGATVASGLDWHGQAVYQKAVIVVLGEGLHTYKPRLIAWKKAHEIEEKIPLFITGLPCHFSNVEQVSALRSLVYDVQKEHEVGMVIVDTLNRNFGDGDESSTPDMTRFLNGLYSLLGESVSYLLVHHTGHMNKERARGAYSLYASLEAEYRVEGIEQTEYGTPGLTMTCTKMRADDYPPPLAFATQSILVDLERDRDSLVLTQIEVDTAIKDQRNQKAKLSDHNQRTIRRVEELRSAGQELNVYELASDLAAIGIYTRPTSAKRAVNSLIKQGFLHIDIHGNFVQVRRKSYEK